MVAFLRQLRGGPVRVHDVTFFLLESLVGAHLSLGFALVETVWTPLVGFPIGLLAVVVVVALED